MGMRSIIKFGVVDVTGEEGFCKEWGITEYPRLTLWMHSKKSEPRTLPGWRSQTDDKALQLQQWIKATINELFPEDMKRIRPAAELMQEKTQPGFEEDDADELEGYEVYDTNAMANDIIRDLEADRRDEL